MWLGPTLCALLFIGVPEDRAVKIDRAITTNCSKYDIDENIVLAVIKHESRFKPRVISNTWDWGAMQIHCHPKKHLPWCPKKRRKLFDPELNIAIGVYLLSRAKRKCKSKKHKYYWVQCYNYGSKGYWRRILETKRQFDALTEGLSTIFESCRKAPSNEAINLSRTR